MAAQNSSEAVKASLNKDNVEPDPPSASKEEHELEAGNENDAQETGSEGRLEFKDDDVNASDEAAGTDVVETPKEPQQNAEEPDEENGDKTMKNVPLHNERGIDVAVLPISSKAADVPVPDEDDQKIQDYDDMFKYKVGQFGLAQAVVIFLICIPAGMPGPIAFFSQLFLAANPDHWCYIPSLTNTTLTTDQIKNLTIPPKDLDKPNELSQCTMYDVDFAHFLKSSNGSIKADRNWPTTTCKFGYSYDKSIFQSTIITEWDLVCKNDIYPTIANGVSNLGMVLGGLLFAYISDKYGRKKGLFVSILLLVVSGIAAAFAPEIYSWMILRMLFVSSMSIFFTVYVYSLEFVGRRYRAIVSLMLTMCYALSLMSCSLLGYFFRDWKTLSLVISVPNSILLLAFFFLPESPRWLLSQGRLDELKIVLTKMAKMNKKAPFTYDLKKFKVDEVLSQKATILDMFKTPNLRKKMLILIYLNLVTAVAYFGLSLFSPSLGSDVYISVLLIGAAEIPGDIIAFVLMDRWGRRWTSALSYVLAGIFLVVSLELQNLSKTMTLVLFLAAKVSITGNYMSLVPFTSELLPTPLRNMGLSITTNTGITGTAAIPFVTYLGRNYMKLPMVIIGAMTILAGFLTLLLPETLHYSLPETVVDAENFGNKMTMKDYTRCIPLKRNRVHSEVEVDSTDL